MQSVLHIDPVAELHDTLGSSVVLVGFQESSLGFAVMQSGLHNDCGMTVAGGGALAFEGYHGPDLRQARPGTGSEALREVAGGIGCDISAVAEVPTLGALVSGQVQVLDVARHQGDALALPLVLPIRALHALGADHVLCELLEALRGARWGQQKWRSIDAHGECWLVPRGLGRFKVGPVPN